MRQDINFLKSFPVASRQLPAVWIFFIVIITVVILFAASVTRGGYQYVQGQQLASARAERIEAELAFQRVVKAYPLFASNKPLVEQVGDYEKSLREKQAEYATFSHATARNPFSKYMAALITSVPPDLWLTDININQDNQNVAFRGYSLRPLEVSMLMEALQTAPLFSALFFDLFFVTKLPDKNYVQFEVATDKFISDLDVEKAVAAEKNVTLRGAP